MGNARLACALLSDGMKVSRSVRNRHVLILIIPHDAERRPAGFFYTAVYPRSQPSTILFLSNAGSIQQRIRRECYK